MDIFILIIVGALVVIVPLALFLGIIGVAIMIWSWRRIGPYFVNLGRWAADWKNFVPLSCAGLIGVILLIVLAAVLPAILRIPILIILIVGAVIFIIFATIVWTVRFLHWFWPRYRVRFWNALEWLWDLAWKGIPGQMERRMPGGPGNNRKPPPKRPLPAATPNAGAATAAPSATAPASPGSPRPPVKRSWLDFQWLWSLLWGAPPEAQGKKASQKPVGQKASQTQTAPVQDTAQKAAGKPKAGIEPLTWRLGLWLSQLRDRILGKPVKKTKVAPADKGTGVKQSTTGMAAKMTDSQPNPAASQVKQQPKAAKKPARSIGDRLAGAMAAIAALPVSMAERFRRKPRGSVKNPAASKPAAAVSGSKPAAVAPASKPSATAASVRKPAKSPARGLIGAVESVRRSFWVGLFWIADRGRAGVDSIRGRLRRAKK